MDTIGNLLTVAQVQNVLKCGKTKVYDLAKAKKLELVKFGKRSRVTERSLEALLREMVDAEKDVNHGRA